MCSMGTTLVGTTTTRTTQGSPATQPSMTTATPPMGLSLS